MNTTVEQIEAILAAAVAIDAEAERRRYLDNACAGDAALRGRLDELVDNHFRAGSFLEPPVSPRSAGDQRVSERPGTTIGAYRLMEQIGEGGMGTVWMAQQVEPVKRLVALKLIKPGMDSKKVLARFEAERQALALMDHPNIARVFDAGTTETGRPFFVMELVKGVPLTKYCDEHRLTPCQRLELFIPICQAIQHAHQKGIIHRDIKPSNVLVALYDGKPVPKVIDFGIAKAMGQQLAEQTLVTGFGNIVGTLEYMSPEQAEMNQLDIDTRSDIYSLGVLLYELLTGSTPLDKKRLKEAAFMEVLRVIREEEPPRPSMRLSDSRETLPSISAQRQMEPAKLTKFVRGELDWIVMKALEKDRSRRYESAGTFAADVERYLKDEPVSAGPPGAGYRLRKFLRRNRGPVLAASLVILALVVGVIGTSLGLVRAQQAQRAEAERAEGERRAKETARQRLTQIERANEILGSVFKDLDPQNIENEGKPLQALLGERLDQAAAQLEGEVIGDPLAVARMQMILGQSQLSLGYSPKAIRLFIKARTTFTAEQGADHPDTLNAMNELARGYYDDGDLDRSVSLFKETLERRKATLGPDHADTLQGMNDLAGGYRALHQLDLAVPLLKETLERRKATLGPDAPEMLESMNSLALAYLDFAEPNSAIPLFEAALKGRKRKLPANHADVLQSMNNLALAYRAAGKVGLSVPLLKETLDRVKEKLGADHPYVLKTMNNLALSYHDDGKLDLALPLYAEVLRRTKVKFPADHPDTLRSMGNLAWGYHAAGKLDLAVPLYQETLTLLKAKFGPDNPHTLGIMNRLGLGYIQSHQPAKAVPLLDECLALRQKNEPDGWRTFETKSLLGAAYLERKSHAEAEPLLLAGYQGMQERQAKIPPQFRICLIEGLERLVQLYEATDDKDKAKEWQKKLSEAKAAAQPAVK
jgi:serine/threonine protein kinase/tetratricopeptide (TPR) repeat protein